MSTSNLTAKYRPQTFQEVAGQEAIKAILSRAAASDKIAPAYLFSGTRGVGKTTIARIFAKALNCVNGPTAEPCNQCPNCKQITAGVAVDVIEIDGASNRGIDDARRLKEDIGYAPVECRYKVFIIDEAHMLTKEAFNALLKTLEEPPPRATFILATTEPHKFPATIISRCQHYIYKMLTQQELVSHLETIMNREALPFEPGALQIIAKRGAGSVRDSMSLLGQALAMGSDVLRETDVRNFLGLAGQDVFFQLMGAMHSRDLIAVGMVLRQVLNQGLDLGFFLRELTNTWRNMFLLCQAGDAAMPLLGFSGEEAQMWMDWSRKFAPAHIHACWQMTLDGQRKVMTSLEPALALELLLFNLTSLPDLIDLESFGATGASRNAMPPQGGGPGGNGGNRGGGFSPQGGSGGHYGGHGPSGGMGAGPQGGQSFSAATPQNISSQMASPQNKGVPPSSSRIQKSFSSEAPISSTAVSMPTVAPSQDSRSPQSEAELENKKVLPGASVKSCAPSEPTTFVSAGMGEKNWKDFIQYVASKKNQSVVNATRLRLNKGQLTENELVITCSTQLMCSQLSDGHSLSLLDQYVKEFFGPMVDVRVETGEITVHKSDKVLREEAEAHPGVNLIMETFSAQILSVSARN